MADARVEQYSSVIRAATAGKEKKEVDAIVSRFLTLVRKRGHGPLLPRILTSLTRHADGHERQVTVKSAQPLTEKERTDIATALAVPSSAVHSIDQPDLLAGVVIEQEGYRIDASARGRLQKVQQFLTGIKNP